MECVYCGKQVLLAHFPAELRNLYKNPTYHIKCLFDAIPKVENSPNHGNKQEAKK